MIFIYVLKCPLSGRPRYVGKTQTPKTRLSSHISKAKSGETLHHCARWIRQLLEQGLKPEFEIVFEVPAEEEWQMHEKRFIADYTASGYVLTNLTGGGGGFYKANPELLARRGRSRSAHLAIPDNKEKFRAVMRAAHGNPEARIAHREGQKLAWQDPIKRESMISGMNTPEAKQRRSDATRRRNADPEFAKSHQERMKKLYRQPGRLVQIRAAQVARWSPNHRARSAKLRAAREIVRQEHRARFLVEQAERLRQRWQDEAHREKMQAARWTDETKARQAAAVLSPDRQAKIKQALTPEVIARRNAAIKDSWARRKARKQEAQTP